MMVRSKIARLFNLRRGLSPSWLKFALLVLTDPTLSYLNYYIRNKHRLNIKDPRPHYAFHTLSWLETMFKENRIGKVFEWGAGNSTLYYARMGCKVVTVEHDRKWADMLLNCIEANKIANIQLMYCENKSEYINVPASVLTEADLIVVDGRFRVECALYIAELIRSGILKDKIILFDDAQRERYKPGIQALKRLSSDWEAFTGLIWVDLDHLTLVFVI